MPGAIGLLEGDPFSFGKLNAEYIGLSLSAIFVVCLKCNENVHEDVSCHITEKWK